MILYLHGFCSAPASHKAQALQRRLVERGIGERFVCPQLPVSPAAAVALGENIIAAAPSPVTVVGSSLGGFYASYLAEKHRLRAVLINPAVLAEVHLKALVGPQENLYTGDRFEFTTAHLDELRRLDVAQIANPQRYWLLLETGDEVLDYRLAVAKYAGAQQTVLPGGDHRFTRWNDYLDEVIGFAVA